MLIILRLTMALDLALTISRHTSSAAAAFLPLGGDDLTQIGILLGAALILCEICDSARISFLKLNFPDERADRLTRSDIIEP